MAAFAISFNPGPRPRSSSHGTDITASVRWCRREFVFVVLCKCLWFVELKSEGQSVALRFKKDRVAQESIDSKRGQFCIIFLCLKCTIALIQKFLVCRQRQSRLGTILHLITLIGCREEKSYLFCRQLSDSTIVLIISVKQTRKVS